MLIVVDTNVFVGACLGLGACSRVIAACIQGRHMPLMGSTLLTEYEDVLSRHPLFACSRLDDRERQELLDIFLSNCRWIRVYYAWRPNLPDEGDNHLFELAIAGNAQAIVSRNLRHLRQGQLHFPDLRLLSPEQFSKEFPP
ncbi:putative toxin-antitoxin system toxin component, PIN family [Vandammella animalimorsus]|uniref:Putative toxin-antitoxin system toxin component, PIN family n=1 Tax=Vandammella animalimorsus TaxID=2029117 RepID=A0A2A2AJM8_9BURK|nr:putative toxin-antitoxin system toxin component, PIN family [Vandammella animalimorsus]PAT37953.1 putative toxin-antitoxin system toxin component, PIN family [Vandammella animalimorsus]